MDIVDLRAETNVISKLGREQGSAFRKSSESQTDAAEVTKKPTLSDSKSKSFLSWIPGCRFWLGPVWQDRHRDTNPKRGCWRPPHWSRWCHRSGLHNNYHLFVSYHISFVAFQTDQRIVFQNSKAVRFSNSEEKVPARKKSSASQTRWELKDKEVQVVLLSSQFWREKKWNCLQFWIIWILFEIFIYPHH